MLSVSLEPFKRRASNEAWSPPNLSFRGRDPAILSILKFQISNSVARFCRHATRVPALLVYPEFRRGARQDRVWAPLLCCMPGSGGGVDPAQIVQGRALGVSVAEPSTRSSRDLPEAALQTEEKTGNRKIHPHTNVSILRRAEGNLHRKPVLSGARQRSPPRQRCDRIRGENRAPWGRRSGPVPRRTRMGGSTASQSR